MNDDLTLLTFPSTFYALKAEKAVQAAGLKGRLIPVPRELSSLCGLALELALGTTGQVLTVLKENGIKLEKKVQVVKERGRIKSIKVMEYEGR